MPLFFPITCHAISTSIIIIRLLVLFFNVCLEGGQKARGKHVLHLDLVLLTVTGRSSNRSACLGPKSLPIPCTCAQKKYIGPIGPWMTVMPSMIPAVLLFNIFNILHVMCVPSFTRDGDEGNWLLPNFWELHASVSWNNR